MKQTVDIATGRLELAVKRSQWSLADLCGFAARNNPRRGFLFVSKVLGKHWPVRAAVMRQTHEALATEVLAPDSGEVVFIGMAETATGLGHGVFDAWAERNESGLYLQSTRYRLDDAEALHFEEAHSHAAEIRLYLPEQAALLERLKKARLAVLIDDEISTGRTLAALIAALRPACPKLDQVQLLCLTDFSAGQAQAGMAEVPGIKRCTVSSLLSGSFSFERDAAFSAEPAESAVGSAGCRRVHVGAYSARLGLASTPSLPAALIEQMAAHAGRRCLVVGTGEFIHGAFLVARALEESGAQAFVQSTSRSPILIGNDIANAVRVPDPYEEGIPNFLYNYRRADYDQVFVVHETPRNAQLIELARILDAEAVRLHAVEEVLA